MTPQQKDFLIGLGKTDIETRKTFPELFGLENGRWYKHKMSSSLVFKVSDEGDGYGFNSKGHWDENNWFFHNLGMWQEASSETVKSALIAEAKKRYEVGDVIDLSDFDDELGVSEIDTSSFPHDGDFYYSHSENYLEFHGFVVFSNGNWASVITPAPSIEDDIKALREKYPDYCLTVIVERK